MAISRVHTWSAGEVLLASDLNAEFSNILNNGSDLVSPFTKAISMGGFALNFDAANTIALTATTSGISLTGGTLREPTEDTLTAFATGGQTNATALSVAKKSHRVSVCATTGDSYKLPTSTAGQCHYVRNDGAAAAQAFGTSPDTINSVATATGIPHPVGVGIWYVCTTAGNWTTGPLVSVSGNFALTFTVAAATNITLPAALTLPAVTAKGDILAASAANVLGKTSVGSDGQAVHADSSQTNGVVYIDNPSRQNLLVNPNWQIDQINEGTLYTVNASDVRGPDGWSGTAIGAGVFKLRTLADPDNAALKCLEITCTTADAAIGATDDYFVYSAIEGYDATSLMTGTASAQAVTVQFKFKTNITGVYGISVANSALNRRYIGIITVSDTSEHEYSASLTMDTSGTWLYTSGVGVYLRLCLSAGSNFQSTAGAWAAGAEQTTSAQANFMSANTNVAYLKRIQLIPGALVQAYRPADLQREFAKSERYYQKTFSTGVAVAQSAGYLGAVSIGAVAATTAPQCTWRFETEMRAAPTVTTYSPGSADANWRNSGNSVSLGTASTSLIGSGGVTLSNSAAAASTDLYCIHVSANARLS